LSQIINEILLKAATSVTPESLPYKQRVTDGSPPGSNPVGPTKPPKKFGGFFLSQIINEILLKAATSVTPEHLPYKQRVTDGSPPGSNPVGPTKPPKKFGGFFCPKYLKKSC
jgi:hypothetical protein